MFGSVFNTVTGLLDKRFLVTYFLPSMLFWSLAVIVWFAGGDNLAAAESWWKSDSTNHTFQIIGFLAWVTLFANVVASQSMRLLRLYEGYWDFPGGQLLRIVGSNWHRRKLARLAAAAPTDLRSYEEIYLSYPLPTQSEEVMPTRLGNILKNSELYPLDRYRIDAVLIWPRLYNLFPDAFKQSIIEMRSNLDFMLVISALAAAFAFLAGGYLLASKASPLTFLACFVGGLFLARLSYRAALGGALLYAQQIKSAFDLYRNELLKQMRVPLPPTRDAERTTWAELCQLLYRNIPPTSWTYAAASAEPSVTAAGLVALLADNSGD